MVSQQRRVATHMFIGKETSKSHSKYKVSKTHGGKTFMYSVHSHWVILLVIGVGNSHTIARCYEAFLSLGVLLSLAKMLCTTKS